MNSAHLFWLIFMGALAVFLAPVAVYLLVVLLGAIGICILNGLLWICDKIGELLP